MTVYSVELARSAGRELEQLADSVAQRVLLTIRALQEHPRPKGSKKLATSEATYRVRVGQYRVVYEVDDSEHRVLITRIRHRKDAYR